MAGATWQPASIKVAAVFVQQAMMACCRPSRAAVGSSSPETEEGKETWEGKEIEEGPEGETTASGPGAPRKGVGIEGYMYAAAAT